MRMLPQITFAVVVCCAPALAEPLSVGPYAEAPNQPETSIITNDELRMLPPEVHAHVLSLLEYGTRYERAIRHIVANHAGPADHGGCGEELAAPAPAPGV